MIAIPVTVVFPNINILISKSLQDVIELPTDKKTALQNETALACHPVSQNNGNEMQQKGFE